MSAVHLFPRLLGFCCFFFHAHIPKTNDVHELLLHLNGAGEVFFFFLRRSKRGMGYFLPSSG